MLDLALQLAVPIIVTAEMTEADFAVELAAMQLRSAATADFIDGEIDAGEWLDVLDGCGIEVASAVRDWTDGINYMS
jgi:hypothetical protein